jgi:hypothetical protein
MPWGRCVAEGEGEVSWLLWDRGAPLPLTALFGVLSGGKAPLTLFPDTQLWRRGLVHTACASVRERENKAPRGGGCVCVREGKSWLLL